MGILGNLLKTAAVVGAGAIPGVGAVAGPLVAGAVGATGGGGLKGAVTGAGSAVAGGLMKGKAPVESETINAPSLDVKGTAGFGGAGQFTPDMVAKDPLGQIAALQVMNGSENLADIFKRKGFGAGGF